MHILITVMHWSYWIQFLNDIGRIFITILASRYSRYQHFRSCIDTKHKIKQNENPKNTHNHEKDQNKLFSRIMNPRFNTLFYHFPVLRSSFIDGDDFLTFREKSLPPVHAFDRIIVRTGDQSGIQKFTRNTNCLWLRRMRDVEEEKWHGS